jgi:lauroyl/myristoyl acyltransferase
MTLASLSSGRLALPAAIALARWVPERPLLRLADTLADRFASETSPAVMGTRANQAVVRGLSKDDPEIDRAVRAVFRSAGRGHVALFRALARGRQALMSGCDVAPELMERIEIARRAGRGLVLVGPHVSAFDFFLLTIAARGYPMQAISPANPTATYRLQNELRTKFGAETTPASREAVKAAIDRLTNGGIVGTGMDRPAPKGDWIEFFGRQAFLPTGFAKLAIRTNSMLLPGVVLPDGPGHYRAEALELLEPPTERTEEAAHGLAREVLRQMEPVIRANADDWLMFHAVWPGA